MKHTICDDEIKKLVSKWRLHQVRLDDSAILQIEGVLIGRVGSIRDIKRKDFAIAMLSDEAGVESRAWPDLEDTLAIPIEGLQRVLIGESKFFAIPIKQKFFVLRFHSVIPKPPPFVGERLCSFGLITDFST